MIRFEAITKDNLDAAIAIKVTAEQDLVIAPVVYSLAECYVFSDILKPFLILNDDEPVGFVLLLIDLEENEYEICRFMIDQNHQRKGYGKEALLLAIDYLRDNGAETIELSHRTDNYGPGKLYQSVGFHYTGIIENEEVMMELHL